MVAAIVGHSMSNDGEAQNTMDPTSRHRIRCNDCQTIQDFTVETNNQKQDFSRLSNTKACTFESDGLAGSGQLTPQ